MIEFQHSPITSDEIEKRNNFYLSCGYNMVWVFDGTDQIKNNYLNNSQINPRFCEENDLCWKRSKEQFAKKTPSNVQVFINYKIIDNRDEISILIKLKSIEPKNFSFYKTDILIEPKHFLKEFGAINDDILSISGIIGFTDFIHNIEILKNKKLQKPQPIYNPPKHTGRGFRW